MRALIKYLCVPVFGLVMAVGSASLVGCNTAEGVGKDTKSVGKSIENTAKDAKD